MPFDSYTRDMKFAHGFASSNNKQQQLDNFVAFIRKNQGILAGAFLIFSHTTNCILVSFDIFGFASFFPFQGFEEVQIAIILGAEEYKYERKALLVLRIQMFAFSLLLQLVV